MREARRLALLERQRLIAEVARKQALRGLAEALEAEARSHALAERSWRLVAAAAPHPCETSGVALQSRSAFTAGLAQLAAGARDGARDASRQRAWQADALAQAETRARRLAELAAEARAALAAARERSEAARELPLARKLQSRG
ncbi:MAG: hypothetical protein ACKO01_12055 [Erythrobacter sp.]